MTTEELAPLLQQIEHSARHASRELIGRNLTDSYYMVSTSGRPAASTTEFIGVFNRPREVALQAEFRF